MPPLIPFAKAHGLGNDFLLVGADDVAGLDPGELARRICDRHTGAGADGLVVVGPSTVADATFRIFNSDGSEAGLSGNALRCAAAWLLGRKGERKRIVLETKVGPRELFFLRREGNAWVLRVEIGKPSFAAASVPFNPPKSPTEPIVGYPLPVGDATVAVSVLSLGNPQCILLADEPVPGEAGGFETLDWMALGAEIERHPFFPDRTNVGFVRVLALDRIAARFWERGAGHTLASGTGSCACAVAAHLNGRTGRRVTVEVARGCLEVNWRDDGMVELTGPAEITVEGSFLWESVAQGKAAPRSAGRGRGQAGGAAQ